jgi:hypothetical protein
MDREVTERFEREGQLADGTPLRDVAAEMPVEARDAGTPDWRAGVVIRVEVGVTEVDDMRRFVSARIDEDERTTQGVTKGPWCAAPTRDDPDSDAITTWEVLGDPLVMDSATGYNPVATCALGDPVELDPFDLVDLLKQQPASVTDGKNAVHIANWDPPRVLAECAAKRALMEAVRGATHEAIVIQHLAAAWAAHPEYRSEWKLWGAPRSPSTAPATGAPVLS